MRVFSLSKLVLAAAMSAVSVWSVDAAAQATPVTREPVEFPREAVKAGVDKGEVKVKVIVDASGAVTDVQILESRPPRMFDRAVRSSLAKWKFNTGEANRTFETLIEFKR
jgi:periplasmic protein TonB